MSSSPSSHADLAPRLPSKQQAHNETTPDAKLDWDDVLGTGTILKRVIERGTPEDVDMEAPRKFFALIDVETKCNGKPIDSESHQNFLLDSDADLFAGPHLAVPLMDIGEKSQYLFAPKFAFGSKGYVEHAVGALDKVECLIKLKFRVPYDEFAARLTDREKVQIARRKKERGKFWFARGDYQQAIAIYQSLNELCKIQPPVDDDNVDDDDCDDAQLEN